MDVWGKNLVYKKYRYIGYANASYTTVVELLPTSMRSVDMNANNPGNWLYQCHVTAGMITRWKVKKR